MFKIPAVQGLYETIRELEEKHGFDNEYIGYLFMKTIFKMPSKSGKYLSRLKIGTKERSVKNVKIAFMRTLRRMFAEVDEVPDIDIDAFEHCHADGELPSIEEALLQKFKQIPRIDVQAYNKFFSGLGEKVKKAEKVYEGFVNRAGTNNYIMEYKLILGYLVPKE